MTMRSLTIQRVLTGGVFFVLCSVAGAFGQGNAAKVSVAATTPTKLPVVTRIDIPGLRKALTASGKPLLVNFWATWCDPCRDEFPDLVKLDAEYKGKIDFITISLDDLAEINRDVPKFLAGMKAEMPAYLLYTTDDDAAIEVISKDFTGALPFSILYGADGKETYSRQGKVVLETLHAEIKKLLAAQQPVRP